MPSDGHLEISCASRSIRPGLHGQEVSEEFTMTHKRVLLADDLEPVLATVSELVSGSFDVVRMVSDGKSALHMILELQPDIAVLDISMPGLSGLEVAKELKRRCN